jgi:hypothetical protein
MAALLTVAKRSFGRRKGRHKKFSVLRTALPGGRRGSANDSAQHLTVLKARNKAFLWPRGKTGRTDMAGSITKLARSRACSTASATTNTTGSRTWLKRSRQRPARWQYDRRNSRYHDNAGKQPDCVCIEIGGGENAMDAGHCSGCRGIDGFDQRMSMG